MIGQLDKPSFQVAVVISPSTVNEDLRDRLSLVCGTFGKKLLILDYPALAQLWQEFQNHVAPFEELDVAQMLKNSKAPKSGKSARKTTKNVSEKR